MNSSSFNIFCTICIYCFCITTGTLREYYIACVEEEWDYAPSGKDLIRGEPITEECESGTWLYGNYYDRIGSKYIKAIYREYTDNTFKTQKQFSSEWQHLGSIGPVIRAIEGDTIHVHYYNKCSFETSMHPHGVQYNKNNEGAPYNDESYSNGDSIKTGNKHLYIWNVRPNSVNDRQTSKLWLYHSHVHEVRDIHSGLMGPIIITKKHKNTDYHNLRPYDIDREFVTFFVLYNENLSLLFDKTINIFLNNNKDKFIEDENFKESNLMHSINGYLFGNLNTLVMKNGETVRWYIASFGNEADGPHSPHWHGNILENYHGVLTDTVTVIPGTTETVTMKTDSPGNWLYHCHVFDHIDAGMMTLYTVKE